MQEPKWRPTMVSIYLDKEQGEIISVLTINTCILAIIARHTQSLCNNKGEHRASNVHMIKT